MWIEVCVSQSRFGEKERKIEGKNEKKKIEKKKKEREKGKKKYS